LKFERLRADYRTMALTGRGLPEHENDGNHFCCSLTVVLIARVRRSGGEDAVARLLSAAGTSRSLEYLENIGNWVSYDEAVALWEAGHTVTGDPDFARHVGGDAVAQLASSATATALRALGSTEALLKAMPVASRRFSTVADLETTISEPGFAEIHATASPGFTRHQRHCEWTTGLLSTVTSLFGLAPATVVHERCQADGAPSCRYLISWDVETPSDDDRNDPDQVDRLKRQIQGLTERLESVFATAADLNASGDVDKTLARITERAALQVRAPRYVLAVRPAPGEAIRTYCRGLDEADGHRIAELALDGDADDHPDHWLVAPVRSHRTSYGSLVAMYEAGSSFFPYERQLLQVYARYAATVLDSAAALAEAKSGQLEAQRRLEESRALLELARHLAAARTSAVVAERLADAVPAVIDCDRVSVYLCDETTGELVRHALSSSVPASADDLMSIRPEHLPRLAELLDRPSPDPIFIDLETSPVRGSLLAFGAVASVAVPIATTDHLLGCLIVSVLDGPERLDPTPELCDRLSGVAAHAVTALENARLLDQITYQASHDQLTGLANRAGFSDRLARARGRAEIARTPVALFYVDLDAFKPVNDQFGHEVGDDLLRAVADRLVERVRPTDTVVRLGGDEFAVLVEDLDLAGIERITARLEVALDEPLEVGDRKFEIRASIGRAVWPADVGDHGSLLRHADAAMYDVKRARPAASLSRVS
jgi:diguanylate cyclase (GGDEF)-like protein